ncbi:hypothetical protein PI124_g12922 [Phytophthora idaei]|nr:hypothetical protein PI125_g13634 [Phytophthora idaei]KAG3140278.1 hypothetical protein PI126_g16088 [Phytophthora idaei]KAG3242231.1 hypothetical protein PI124_g12922 [Phytophthora idaei]
MMRICSVILVAAVLLAKVEWAASFELTPADYPTVVRSLADYQSGAAPTRLLRRYDDDEERAIGGLPISEMATKITSGASKLVNKLVNMKAHKTRKAQEAQEAQAAKTLKHDSIEDTLTSSNIDNLANQVTKFNSKNTIKVSQIGTLTSKYGDDMLASALVTAETGATPVLSRQLQQLREEQLERWIKGDKSADDVIKLLKIRHNDPNFSQKLKVLDDYVKRRNPTNSDQTLFSTLIKEVPGETMLVELLRIAKVDSRTKAKAKQLETSLISRWENDHQLPANVFQWLKLYVHVDNAFKADNLNKFMKYVQNYNVNNPNNKKPLIEFYTNAFGDAAVVSKLVSAMGYRGTRDIAKKLQTEQVEGWIKNRIGVDRVVKILNFESNEGAAITRRKLAALVQFLVNKGGDGNQKLIQTLTRSFGSRRKLALILEQASETAESTSLQKMQFAAFKSKGISPEDFMFRVFKTVPNSASEEQNTIAAKFNAFYLKARSNSVEVNRGVGGGGRRG